MLKHDAYWRRQQTIRQGIVIVIVVAFATILFVGAIRVMTVGQSAQATAQTSPTVEYDDDYDDDAASQDASDESNSPASD